MCFIILKQFHAVFLVYSSTTFAQDYATYWVGVESPGVSVLQNSIEVQQGSQNDPAIRTKPPSVTTSPYYDLPTRDTTPAVIYHLYSQL